MHQKTSSPQKPRPRCCACKVTYDAGVCTRHSMSYVRTHGASLSLEPAETVIMMAVPEGELVAGGSAGKSFTAVSRPHRHISHCTIADVGANTVKSIEWRKWYEPDTPSQIQVTSTKQMVAHATTNCYLCPIVQLHVACCLCSVTL